jgi:hypothetical protein
LGLRSPKTEFAPVLFEGGAEHVPRFANNSGFHVC